MKRYYLNSKLTKLLLFSAYSTISIGWFVFSKKEELTDKTKIHETIHALQWTEITILSILIISLLSCVISPFWILISPLIYYIWYILEWLIRLLKGDTYRNILFEKEAYKHDNDSNYLHNRELFNWLNN